MPKEVKWHTLSHNGVAFPEPYNYRGLQIMVKGKPLKLDPIQEEMAMAWAKKKDTVYVKDPVFASNFLLDFKKVLPAEFSDIHIGDLDFSELHEIVEREKTVNLSKEERKQRSIQRKAKREALKERFGYAIVDGEKYEVGNWMVEPPGIFIGRGAHPLRGRWKHRVQPNEVTLNLGEDSPVPPGSWGKVVHDHSSTWLACWTDRLSNVIKYVWLSDNAPPRQERDKRKYDIAARLDSSVEKVRAYIRKQMSSRDEKTRKIATVCYLIDKLSMRVGDEKDEDEADTVGASTLRTEHIHIENDDRITFNFLGKDSVRWERPLIVPPEDSIVLQNMKEFIKGKKEGELVFDGISSDNVNRFLALAMNGLTAKVFRTYHATAAVCSYLSNHDVFPDDTYDHVKLFHAKMANLNAAINCNHKRTIPKNWEETLRKKEEKLEKYKTMQPKSEKGAEAQRRRIDKLTWQIKLQKETRDYNLNTSLRNYIDPRIYKAWGEAVGFDYQLLYTKALQRKFSWVTRSRLKWTRGQKSVASLVHDRAEVIEGAPIPSQSPGQRLRQP
jgi:DNA topoisomerase-1